MKNSLKLALFLAFFMLERRGALMLAETKKTGLWSGQAANQFNECVLYTLIYTVL